MITKNSKSEELLAMKTPAIVSPEEWEAARQQLLVKEKELTRTRDAMAAQRRRMPWMAVETKYEFDGPNGKVSLLDLFERPPPAGRLPRLLRCRACSGWPDHACRRLLARRRPGQDTSRTCQRPRYDACVRFARAAG